MHELTSSQGPAWSPSAQPHCPPSTRDIPSACRACLDRYAERVNFQAIWLHGIPFTFRVAQKGTDPSDWYVFDLFYCGNGPFQSAAELLAASPPRCTYKPDPALEGHKGAWDVPGPDGAHALRQALRAGSEPVAARYEISGGRGGNGRLVRWQGWSFFASLRPSTGLAAMDVRFKGARVAYELALSEAAAHYSGTGADQVCTQSRTQPPSGTLLGHRS